MIKIGLTGGIGSGKSTVLKLWEEHGAFVIRADDLAKKLMQEDPELKSSIQDVFGEKAYDDKGELNRAFLSREAFSRGRVQELNAMVHPKVRSQALKEIDRAAAEGYKAFVYEAALLLKNGRPDYLDYIVMIQASRDKRIEWVARRDGVDAEEVKRRMQHQQNNMQMKQWADFIINNDGSIQKLKDNAISLFEGLLEP